MKPLKQYVKPPTKQHDTVTRSVMLHKRHDEFVKRLNLNLSAMLRDWLDELMARTPDTGSAPDTDGEGSGPA